MRKRTFFTSSVYSTLEASGGLLLHPYQTMQHLVEEKVFLWLALIPSALAVFFLLLWWTLLELSFIYLPFIGIWAFVLIWACCFFLFWQVLLLYLFFRFLLALR